MFWVVCGPDLGTAAVVHLAAATRVLDDPGDSAGLILYEDDVATESVGYEAGHLLCPAGLGLGIDIDEDKLEILASTAT